MLRFPPWKRPLLWKSCVSCSEVYIRYTMGISWVSLNGLLLEGRKAAWQFWWNLTCACIFGKKFDGQMLIRILPTSFLQICCELILYSQYLLKVSYHILLISHTVRVELGKFLVEGVPVIFCFTAHLDDCRSELRVFHDSCAGHSPSNSEK